jgi:hypothetical protein
MINGADYWERIVHHKIHIPFGTESLFMYIVFFLWFELGCLLVNIYILGIEILLNTLILMVSMEFDNLADDFGEFDYKKADKKKLKELIERHNELLAVADEMNALFRLPIFVFFSVSAVIICFSLLQFTSHGDQLASMGFTQLLNFVKFAGYLIFNQLRIYLLCFFCEKLRKANDNIAKKIFNGNWHECNDLRVVKDMKFVLANAQKPVELKALVFFGVNMETFTHVSLNLTQLVKILNVFDRFSTPPSLISRA